MRKQGLIDYGSIIAAMIFWSFTFIWVKIALTELRPISIVLFRLVFASALLIPFTLITKKLKKVSLKDLKWFLLLTVFEPFLYFIGESYGMQYVSSTIGSVMIATIPLFAPIAAWYFAKEKLSLMNFIGIVISIAGVVVVIYTKKVGIDASLKGILFMLLAVVSAIGYSIVLKNLTGKYNILSIITYQSFAGIFLFLPLFFALDFSELRHLTISKDVIIAVAELSFFGSCLAFIFFTYAVRQIGISKANSFSNLIPVFTAIFAYFTLGEILNIQKIIGILIVISGLFLSQIRNKKKGKVINSAIAHG